MHSRADATAYLTTPYHVVNRLHGDGIIEACGKGLIVTLAAHRILASADEVWTLHPHFSSIPTTALELRKIQ